MTDARVSAPARIVIHRDTGQWRWFEYGGHRFTLSGGNANGGNEGWGYEVYDAAGRMVQDGYFTLADIRRNFPSDFLVWKEDRTL